MRHQFLVWAFVVACMSPVVAQSPQARKTVRIGIALPKNGTPEVRVLWAQGQLAAELTALNLKPGSLVELEPVALEKSNQTEVLWEAATKKCEYVVLTTIHRGEVAALPGSSRPFPSPNPPVRRNKDSYEYYRKRLTVYYSIQRPGHPSPLDERSLSVPIRMETPNNESSLFTEAAHEIAWYVEGIAQSKK